MTECIHHILVDRIAFERQGAGGIIDCEFVVRHDGLVAGYAWEEGFPSPGEPCKVVGFDTSGHYDAVIGKEQLVQQDRGSIACHPDSCQALLILCFVADQSG